MPVPSVCKQTVRSKSLSAAKPQRAPTNGSRPQGLTPAGTYAPKDPRRQAQAHRAHADRLKLTGLKPTGLKLTGLKLTELKLTGLKPTELKLTELKPQGLKPAGG